MCSSDLIGTCTLLDGTCVVTTKKLLPGKLKIWVGYGGDATYGTGSKSIVQTILRSVLPGPAAGPLPSGVVTDLRTWPGSVAGGAPLAVSATLAADAGVAGGEVRVGDGAWIALAPADGTFDAPVEAVTGTIAAPFRDGTAICVRAIGPDGSRSTPACITVTLTGVSAIADDGDALCLLLPDGSVTCTHDPGRSDPVPMRGQIGRAHV